MENIKNNIIITSASAVCRAIRHQTGRFLIWLEQISTLTFTRIWSMIYGCVCVLFTHGTIGGGRRIESNGMLQADDYKRGRAISVSTTRILLVPSVTPKNVCVYIVRNWKHARSKTICILPSLPSHTQCPNDTHTRVIIFLLCTWLHCNRSNINFLHSPMIRFWEKCRDSRF